MRIKEFKGICRMAQKSLKKHLVKKLTQCGRDVLVGDGWVYSEGKLPIAVCAHLDTVHKNLPSTIYNSNGRLTSPDGIGGDDRCGVYMILDIIKELDVHVMFFEDEESGGIGSDKFTRTDTFKNLKGRLNYVIELDRKGNNDAVFYECDNPDFTDFVTEKFWKEAYGSFTDICNICPGLGCAGVNLSCGYYNQHRLDEYVIFDEMRTATEKAKELIRRSDGTFFEYIEAVGYWKKWNYGTYGYGAFSSAYTQGKENDYVYEDERYLIEYITGNGFAESEIYAMSEYEAIGIFLVEHPTLTYNDISQISFGY